MYAWRSLVGWPLGAWVHAIGNSHTGHRHDAQLHEQRVIAAFPGGGALMAWRPTAATPRPAFQGCLSPHGAGTGVRGRWFMLRPSSDQNQVSAGLVGLLSGMT